MELVWGEGEGDEHEFHNGALVMCAKYELNRTRSQA